MSKPPDIPLELFAKCIDGQVPVVIGGVSNIIVRWINRGIPEKPRNDRLIAWANIRYCNYTRYEDRIIEAFNEFAEAFLPVWIQKNNVGKKLANNAHNARLAMDKLKSPYSKKQEKISDDGTLETSHVLDIPYTIIPDVFVKSSNIDTNSRSKAIKNRRNKPSEQTLFSD